MSARTSNTDFPRVNEKQIPEQESTGATVLKIIGFATAILIVGGLSSFTAHVLLRELKYTIICGVAGSLVCTVVLVILFKKEAKPQPALPSLPPQVDVPPPSPIVTPPPYTPPVSRQSSLRSFVPTPLSPILEVSNSDSSQTTINSSQTVSPLPHQSTPPRRSQTTRRNFSHIVLPSNNNTSQRIPPLTNASAATTASQRTTTPTQSPPLQQTPPPSSQIVPPPNNVPAVVSQPPLQTPPPPSNASVATAAAVFNTPPPRDPSRRDEKERGKPAAKEPLRPTFPYTPLASRTPVGRAEERATLHADGTFERSRKYRNVSEDYVNDILGKKERTPQGMQIVREASLKVTCADIANTIYEYNSTTFPKVIATLIAGYCDELGWCSLKFPYKNTLADIWNYDLPFIYSVTSVPFDSLHLMGIREHFRTPHLPVKNGDEVLSNTPVMVCTATVFVPLTPPTADFTGTVVAQNSRGLGYAYPALTFATRFNNEDYPEVILDLHTYQFVGRAQRVATISRIAFHHNIHQVSYPITGTKAISVSSKPLQHEKETIDFFVTRFIGLSTLLDIKEPWKNREGTFFVHPPMPRAHDMKSSKGRIDSSETSTAASATTSSGQPPRYDSDLPPRLTLETRTPLPSFVHRHGDIQREQTIQQTINGTPVLFRINPIPVVAYPYTDDTHTSYPDTPFLPDEYLEEADVLHTLAMNQPGL